MKFSTFKTAAVTALLSAALLAEMASAQRAFSFVTAYYPDASLTGQAVGYRSVGCDNNVRMDGVKTAFEQVEGEVPCYTDIVGYWDWDWVDAPWYVYTNQPWPANW